jgi:hypothetical protein
VPEIVIRRCQLRVVRRGGWSWGEDPKGMIHGIVGKFPAVLAERLAALFPEEEAREFAAPVRLRLPVRLSELSGGMASEWRINRAAADLPLAAGFVERLDGALGAALALGSEAAPEPEPTSRFARIIPQGEESAASGAAAGRALPSLLLEWARNGALEHRLAALSDEQIAVWHAALSRAVAEGGAAADQPIPGNVARIEEFLRARTGASVIGTTIARLRRRVLLAGEAAPKFEMAIDDYHLWLALDLLFPLQLAPDRTGGASEQDPAAGLRGAPIGAAKAPPQAGSIISVMPGVPPRPAVWRSPSTWEVKIECSLPFLLLGPLTRLGYIGAVAAVLEAARIPDEAPLLAAALAYKVLDPPARGWRRSAASVEAAAAFAGSQEAIAEAALVDFSRRIAPHIGALDVVLADAVIAGHVCEAPMVLHGAKPKTGTGLLLVDTPGCFPLACADVIDPLLAILRRLGAPVVMISGDSATPGLLRDLDQAGLAFVTDAPPTRHERWQRVQQGTQALGWTNSPEPGSQRVLGAARKLAAACADAEDLWQELSAVRPAVVQAHSPALDRHLTVAAGVAIGTAAWEMWQGSATVNRQKALHRYCDLDARVRFDRASVLVSLPMGRRHQELDKAGLLRPVTGVPWLGGRRLEFSGG